LPITIVRSFAANATAIHRDMKHTDATLYRIEQLQRTSSTFVDRHLSDGFSRRHDP
jgi:hypothetical protein